MEIGVARRFQTKTLEEANSMTDKSLRATVSTIPTGLGRLLLAAVASVALPLAASAQTITPTPLPGKPAAPAASPAPAAEAKPKPAAPKPAAPAADHKVAVPDLKPEDDPNPWVRVCSKDEDKKNTCLVAKELRDANNRLIGQVAVREVEGDPKKVLMISVPPPVLVQPGLRVGIDNGKLEEGKFTICFPNTCLAEMPISDQFVADMKKGKVLMVRTLDLQQKAMGFPFILVTFKQAAEGPAIDPSAGQQSQEQLQQQLQKKAEEAAKKLGGDAPAAPAAPAAPKP